MSIFTSIFGKAAETPAHQPVVPVQPGNVNPPTVAVDPNNPTVPLVAPVVEKDNSPLAEFGKLWDDEPKNKGDDAATLPVALTAENLQKVMAKTDFSKAVTPEQMEAITAGGEGATTALMQVMNSTVQAAMVQSTLINNKLTEKAVATARQEATDSIPALLRNQAAADHAKNSNPIFKNPAVTPVIEATQQQLLQKFPEATPAEITEMTQKYILAMGEAFTPTPAVSESDATGQDWTMFA